MTSMRSQEAVDRLLTWNGALSRTIYLFGGDIITISPAHVPLVLHSQLTDLDFGNQNFTRNAKALFLEGIHNHTSLKKLCVSQLLPAFNLNRLLLDSPVSRTLEMLMLWDLLLERSSLQGLAKALSHTKRLKRIKLGYVSTSI